MKVGMCQLLVEGGEPDRNLERARIIIEDCAGKGCQLAILPETLDLGWTHPSVYKESEPIPGPRSNFFCDLAKKNSIWLCLGLTERSNQKNYNTAILINDKGVIVYKYHKINLLEVELPFYEIGRWLSVADTPLGRIGINICSDNYIESLCLGHALARMGAQIILSPASWTVDHSISENTDPYKNKWVKPLSTLVRLYEIPVVSVTSVGYIVGGPYEGKKMVGISLAIDRDGNVARGEFNEFAGDLKIVELELGLGKWKGTQFTEMLRGKGGTV